MNQSSDSWGYAHARCSIGAQIETTRRVRRKNITESRTFGNLFETYKPYSSLYGVDKSSLVSSASWFDQFLMHGHCRCKNTCRCCKVTVCNELTFSDNPFCFQPFVGVLVLWCEFIGESDFCNEQTRSGPSLTNCSRLPITIPDVHYLFMQDNHNWLFPRRSGLFHLIHE